MIRVVKRSGNHPSSPSPVDPWKVKVSLFSNCDTTKIYDEYKDIIKSWLGLITGLMMKSGGSDVLVGTTLWENGKNEFSFNYTMTKLNDLLLEKKHLSSSIHWRWINKESSSSNWSDKKKKIMIGPDRFKNLDNNHTLVKPIPTKFHEIKDSIVPKTTKMQKIKILNSHDVFPTKLIELSEIKSVRLRRIKRTEPDSKCFIEKMMNLERFKQTFYSSRFIGLLLKRLMKIRYRSWNILKIKVKAFLRLRSFFLSGFVIHGNVLYHKHSNTQYIIAGIETPPHLKMIDKAIRNKELIAGDVVKIVYDSVGQKIYRDGKHVKFTKYKNYKKPRVKIKKNDGSSVESVYPINPEILRAVSSLTSQFWKAKEPINLNRRSKFADRVIKHCKIIYNSMDQVRTPIELINVCWRFIDSITIIRDVLFEFNTKSVDNKH